MGIFRYWLSKHAEVSRLFKQKARQNGSIGPEKWPNLGVQVLAV